MVTESDGVQIGTVKSWFDVKGFGFIVLQNGPTEDVFVHYTQVRMEGRRSLIPGQQVWLRLERRDRGLVAIDVEVVKGAVGQDRCHACGQELRT